MLEQYSGSVTWAVRAKGNLTAWKAGHSSLRPRDVRGDTRSILWGWRRVLLSHEVVSVPANTCCVMACLMATVTHRLDDAHLHVHNHQHLNVATCAECVAPPHPRLIPRPHLALVRSA